MADNLEAKELAAISLLKRAVELDSKKRKTEALLCYKEGLQIFMEVLKSQFFQPFLDSKFVIITFFSTRLFYIS
jgi:hypothetical protein